MGPWHRSRGSGDPHEMKRRRCSDLKVPDVKRLLVDVDGVRARGQTPYGGQVATVAPHGLDDEDPPLGAAGRLFDAVTCLNESVE